MLTASVEMKSIAKNYTASNRAKFVWIAGRHGLIYLMLAWLYQLR